MSRLCLGCGLCCNGVLFADVCLVVGDAPAALRAAGLKLEFRRPGRGASTLLPWRFPQPCRALLGDNACALYANRPSRCRTFECGLLQRVAGDAGFFPAAERRIAATRKRVQRLIRLLEQLSAPDTGRPLFARVQALRRRFDRRPPGPEQAALFADLTVAAHQLRLALSREFSPAEGTPAATCRALENAD